jgi:putative ABC transport system permease protein
VNVPETARVAWQGVTVNKPRSALTTLGILIGVAAVIVLVAVGTGSSQAVLDQISSLGSNTLTVSASSTAAGGRGGPAGGFFLPPGGGGASTSQNATQTRNPELTMADAQAIADATGSTGQASAVLGVAPLVSATSVTATYDGASHSVGTFTGSTPSYLLIDNTTVAVGRSFTDAEYTAHRRVAVVGRSVAEDLVGSSVSDLLGKQGSFNGIGFQVVGIRTAKGSTGPQDQDDRVIAPATSVQDTLSGYGPLDTIEVKATSPGTVDLAQSQVETILDGRHHVTSADRDYSVNSASSILEAATSSNRTFTVLLGAVAAISLLVGGIGVMNIMLVTVTERTREIGIRKAVGARRGDIVGQFLVEAVLLSVFGGATGVLVGLVGSHFTIVGVQPVVAPYSVALAFGVAVAIGLVFGLYPANRAAALRPIDALRDE